MRRHFNEGGLVFEFTDNYYVIKLDESRYYRHLSGRGLKCVDFLVVEPKEGLFLIECKDYTQYGGTAIPSNLEVVFEQKTKDSKQFVRVVYKYLRRKLYFRIIEFLGLHQLMEDEWLAFKWAAKAIEQNQVFFIGIVDY